MFKNFANLACKAIPLRKFVNSYKFNNSGLIFPTAFSSTKSHFQFSSFFRKMANLAAESATTSKVPPNIDKIIGYWMLGCAGMVSGAVVIGGVTRLTESGLSMVEWRLIKDMQPPKNKVEWEMEFEKYKQFPEYQHHGEMTLTQFKYIWYMEYAHRMWGRATGLAFLLPAAFFLAKGWVKKPMKIRMVVYSALIAFQGYLGWYMVKSGLTPQADDSTIPRVSQYRLAAHLSTALMLYALFLWSGLTHLLKHQYVPRSQAIARLYKVAHANHALVFLTCVAGAFVAGLDAGLVYNSWPKMAEQWIPDDLLAKSPMWRNLFENGTTTQFIHRCLGESVVLCAAGVWWVARSAPLTPRTRAAVNCVLAMSLLQATLGISTLLTYVPTWLAACHQGGAVTLFTVALWLTHECRKLPK